MKIACFLFLMVLLSAQFVEAKAIVLMTSLELGPKKLKQIEGRFADTFKSSGHDLKIYHSAGPVEIYGVLRSPDTIAAFWISHSAGETKLAEGLGAGEIIQDIWRNDVRQFFSTVNPNLRYLGIVGCQTQGIFTKFKDAGHFENNPELIIHSEKKKVELFRSLKRALKEGVEVLSRSESLSDVTKEEVVHFEIKREAGKSGWLVLGDKVLEVLSEDHAKKIYRTTFPKERWEKLEMRNIRFVENRQYAHEEKSLGALRIRVKEDESVGWDGYKNKEGNFMGREKQNLYVFKRSSTLTVRR